MYIDFDEYSPYSAIISEIFETYINDNIQFDHGYVYSSRKQKMCTCLNEESWDMINNCFPDAKQIKNHQNHSMQIMYMCLKKRK